MVQDCCAIGWQLGNSTVFASAGCRLIWLDSVWQEGGGPGSGGKRGLHFVCCAIECYPDPGPFVVEGCSIDGVNDGAGLGLFVEVQITGDLSGCSHPEGGMFLSHGNEGLDVFFNISIGALQIPVNGVDAVAGIIGIVHAFLAAKEFCAGM